MGIKVNDVVLAHHGVMIYEAKVLKIDHGSGVHEDNDKIKPTANTMYFVHYQGWHKKWDEWVAVSRILEDTPANRKVQAEAKANAAKESANKKASAKAKKINTGGIDPGTARKSPFKKMKINHENDTEEMVLDKDEIANSRQITLQMPFSLKKQLVEDWKHITHEPHKLVPLPRKPCVAQV
jgi:mortality factor 4-like protein 1